MCTNDALVDSLECHMDEMVETFEDFVKKSLLMLSVALGTIILMVMYVLKVLSDRATCPHVGGPVRATNQETSPLSQNIHRGIRAGVSEPPTKEVTVQESMLSKSEETMQDSMYLKSKEPIKKSMFPKREDTTQKSMFPKSQETTQKSMFPNSEESMQESMYLKSKEPIKKSMFPKKEDTTQKFMFPKSEETTQKSMFPKSQETTQKSMFPKSQETTQKSMFPKSEETTQKSMFPKNVDTIQESMFPKSEENKIKSMFRKSEETMQESMYLKSKEPIKKSMFPKGEESFQESMLPKRKNTRKESESEKRPKLVNAETNNSTNDYGTSMSNGLPCTSSIDEKLLREVGLSSCSKPCNTSSMDTARSSTRFEVPSLPICCLSKHHLSSSRPCKKYIAIRTSCCSMCCVDDDRR